MKLIVADRFGSVYSTIGAELIQRRIQVPLVWAMDRKRLFEYLRLSDDLVVISTKLLPGYTTNELLAKEVKQVNPRAVYIVYDGAVKQYAPCVDLRIPSFVNTGSNTFGQHIVDFLVRNLFVAGTGVYVQLELELEIF